MSDETRQEKSSVESTVGGAAKTGKAIANIAKGAAVGGAHGAAIEAAKTSKKWIVVIVALIALPKKAVSIEWDVDSEEDLESLPTEVNIPPELTDIDEISDYLSDWFLP